MSYTYTSNLGLKKPDYNSPADIADINANMDEIDSKFNASGQILDAAKLGGRAPEYYTWTDNLLMNSNFCKPYLINLGGLTEYAATGENRETISGWTALKNTSVYINADGYIEIAPQASNNRGFKQTVKNPSAFAGKTLTAAVKIKSVATGSGIFINDGTQTGQTIKGPGVYTVTKEIAANPTDLFVQIGTDGETDSERTAIEWIVLITGAYTAETLPQPHWLHPRLEMMRMGLPTDPVNLLDNSDFRNPVNQRGQTSYSGKDVHTIDRWIDGHENLNVTINSGFIALNNTDASSRRSFYQRFPENHIGKTLTVAFCDSSGNIRCSSGLVPPINSEQNQTLTRIDFDGHTIRLELNTKGVLTAVFMIGTNSTLNICWIAVYEGAYTLETLPPYRPKENELAACMRRFIVFATPANAKTGYSGYAHSDKEARIMIPLPSPMDVPSNSANEPSITPDSWYSSCRLICNGNQDIVPTSVSAIGSVRNNNGEIIAVTVSVATGGGLAAGHPCVFKQNSGAFAISTDL